MAMKNKNMQNYKGTTKEKKELLKKLMGSASTQNVDFNKVRDEWKYATN